MFKTFWHILEFVSKSLSTPSETNQTEKTCRILSEESVFASCRKVKPLQGGRLKSHAFLCSCIYPIRKVDVHPKLVLLGRDLCSFASAKQFCTVLSLSTELVLLLGNRSWRELLNYENQPLTQISPQFSSLSLT